MKAKEGDMLVIKPLNNDCPHPSATHSISCIEFPVGKLIDPVSGKQCRGLEFVEKPQDRYFGDLKIKP